jgi:hypothetical protein
MAASVSLDLIMEQLFAVLREAFEGPKERWSYFTDNRPDAGLFGTLARLDADKASRSLGGTTIAAHVHHMIFAMDASAAWISGDHAARDWKESWRVSTVDPPQWDDLLERFRKAFAGLNRSIEMNGMASTEAMGEAFGALAHAAYHLGAVRQKMLFLRDGA